MVVVYFDQHLEQFSAPKTWTSSLGWKPESETLNESRKFRMNSTSEPANPSDLSVLVQDEKMQNDAFEETLRQVNHFIYYEYSFLFRFS
jgi:hypothetical protein